MNDDPETDFTSPIAGRIEVREPCPWCADRPMVPRSQMDEHVARMHPDVQTVEAPTFAGGGVLTPEQSGRLNSEWGRGAASAVPVAAPPTEQAALRDDLERVLHEMHLRAEFDAAEDVDAVLAVLPPPADQAAVLRKAAVYVRTRSADPVFDKATVSTALVTVSEGLDRMADDAPTATATVAELAHAVDNSTPYPIELDPQVCRFMAERLLEMLTVGKRPEHPVWQPEEELPSGTQPQPEDPSRLAAETPQRSDVGSEFACQVDSPDVAGLGAVDADLNGALIEDYLRFLRGQGPEPDLSDLPPSRRKAITGQFEIVKALADRDPELPPLGQDPVARRLGLHAPAAETPQPETQAARGGCPDPIECRHEAALGEAQQQVRRLGLMVDEYGAGASALTDKLKRVRDLHRETCIAAKGAVPPTAFRCGMCDVLDAPATTAPAVVQADGEATP